MSSKSQSTDSTDNEQPTPTTHKSGMTRRDLLRRSAAGAATVGAVSTGAVRLDHGPVGNSQAIAPAVAAAGLASAAGISLGWSLRDSDPLGSDPPDDGLTESALAVGINDTAMTRESTNASSFFQNNELVQNAEHVAYSDGKIAAIEKLNEQEAESVVLEAGLDAVDEYFSKTILSNFFGTWNESVNELYDMVSRGQSHPDTSDDTYILSGGEQPHDFGGFQGWSELDPHTYELPNGDEIDVQYVASRHEYFVDAGGVGPTTDTFGYSPVHVEDSEDSSNELEWQKNVIATNGSDSVSPTGSANSDEIEYLQYSEWNDLYSSIMDVYEVVTEGLETWVEGVYGDVQSGDLVVDDLLTPREQAQLTSEDENIPQALADLQALNVSVDLEREAEIYFPEVDATAYGQLSYNGDGTFEVGEVDPEEDYGRSIYFTYDISQGEGNWSEYDEGIDGGTLTFTSEPFAESIFVVETAAGETVQIHSDDFEENDGDEWTVDLSDDLENAITNVESVQFYSDVDSTQYETILLGDPFEIISFTDSDGETYESTDYEQNEPQSDDNFISQDEWDEQQEQYEELIEKYEDSQGGISIPGVEDVIAGEANGLIGIAVVGMVLVSAILSALNPLS